MMFLTLAFVVAGAVGLVRGEAVYIIPPSSGGGSGTAELKYQAIKQPGEIIPKPSCTSGNPYIFVFPAAVFGGTGYTLYPITGFFTFATDMGDGTWMVRAQLKESSSPSTVLETANAIQTIVQVWCCVNPDCN